VIARENDDPLDAVLRGEDVPWHAFGWTTGALLDACATREIPALVYQRRRHTAHVNDWPEDACAALARLAGEAEATALLRGREIASVLDALASAGVRPILLKGAALAYTTYGSPGSRPHADTDLFIRRDQIETVKRVMIALGYVEPAMSGGELIFCQFAMDKRDRFGVDHAFDFHWKISTQSVFAGVIVHGELEAEAVPVPALGPHARTAGPVHALLLACVHPVMHHRGIERVIWIHDIHLLVSRMTASDLTRFAALAVDARMAAVCAHQLARSRARFHTRVPDEVMQRLSSVRSVEPSAVYLQPQRRWHHELASNVQGLPRWTDRLRLLREVIFPGGRYMKQMYRLDGSRAALLPAAYVHRCVHGAWKIARGRK
jgi:hypothetical protein